MKTGLKGALLAIGVCCLFGLSGVWYAGSKLTEPTNSAVAMPAAPARFASIRSGAEVRLAATFWPGPSPDAPALLMLHGNGSNRGSMSELASVMNRKGYAVLAIDFRGHGQSSPVRKSFGLFEAEDARAGYQWLRAANPKRKIAIVGFSLGGAASLLGRQGPIPADALVLIGVYPDIRHAIFNRLGTRLGTLPASVVEPMLSYQALPRYGVWPSDISPVSALSKVKVPVMIVGGGADTNTPPSETKAMFEAVKGARELQILQGVSHDRLGRELSAEFEANLLAFLDRNVKAHR